MKNHPFILLIISLLPSVAYAQYGYITGKVTDRFGPIPNAAISMQGSPFGTFTDDQGYFAFEIDTGMYQLTIDLTGYQPYSLTIKLGDLEQRELQVELENTLMDGTVGVGTKSKEAENQIDSPVPVDLILAEDLINTGEIELGPALHQLLPNFYSAKQSADDAVNVIDPVSLRGLGPDQLLVLVNGKRRHKTAFLNVSDVFGKGTAGTDINVIPVAAVEKIEILRDGASSQYGSDAIAGVMNIVLKGRVSSTSIETYGGLTSSEDGLTRGVTFNTGFGINERGFINVTGSFAQQTAVNRAGNYTGPITGNPAYDSNSDSVAAFFAQTGFPNNTIAELGSSEFEIGSLFLNSKFEVTERFDVYSFASISNKVGHIDAIYRLPASREQLSFWTREFGFSPQIVPEVLDRSLVIGFSGNTKSDWFVDVSYNSGSNLVEMNVENSNNASMGFLTPFNAYSGGYKYNQDIISADFSREFERGRSKLDLSFGAEYRIENYHLKAGEESSYLNGGDSTFRPIGDTIVADQPRDPGIQGYFGVRPEDALEEKRTNASAYLELDYTLEKLKLVAALRAEEYSDFGARNNFKIALSYRLIDKLVVRGSVSTGFKAPSLPQIYYQRTSNILTENGYASVSIINSQTELIGNFFALEGTMNPEVSENLNIGFTSALNRNVSFSLDFYQTNIYDRIGLSQRIPTTITNFTGDETDQLFIDVLNSFENQGVDFLQLFTNIVDTKTRGFDLVFLTQYPIGSALLNFDSRFSYLENSNKSLVEDLEQAEAAEIQYNRGESAIISTYVPNYKWRNSLTLTLNRFKLNLSHTLYGETTYLHPEDGDPNSWLINQNTGMLESRDQTFAAKHLFNANLKLRVLPSSTLTVGAVNLTDQYPDPLSHSENVLFGVNTYSQSVRPFDLRGAYYFARFDFSF